MRLILLSFLLSLTLTNVFLHSSGAYLLIRFYKNHRQKAQQLYLIHLSISICCINLLESLRSIAEIIVYVTKGPSTMIVEKWRHYASIISSTGFSFVFYMIIVYVTLDRLMVIALNHYHMRYWNVKRAKNALLSTWLIGFIIAITVCILYHISGYEWKIFIYEYFFPTIDFVFIALALTTYSVIFYKHMKSRKIVIGHIVNELSKNHLEVPPRNLKHKHLTKTNQKRVILPPRVRKAVYLIPFLLVTNFFLFFALPDLIYLFVAIVLDKIYPNLSTICWISYGVGNILDAFIYIFLQDRIRVYLKRRFSSISLAVRGSRVSSSHS